MSGSTKYHLPVSSTAHPSVRECILNKWGCVVVVATMLYNFLLNGLLFNYNLLFVAFQEEFESSATLTGWIGSLPLGISLMVAPFIKLASERFGYRSVSIAGVVSTSAGVLVTSFLPRLLPMFGTFGVMNGIGAGLFTVCAFDLIVLYFPERNTITAVALASTGSTAGMLVFSQIMALLITRFGWRVTLRIMAALHFGIGFPSVLTFSVPKHPRSKKENNNTFMKLEPTGDSSSDKPLLHEKSREENVNSPDKASDACQVDSRELATDVEVRRTEERLHDDGVERCFLTDEQTSGRGSKNSEDSEENPELDRNALSRTASTTPKAVEMIPAINSSNRNTLTQDTRDKMTELRNDYTVTSMTDCNDDCDEYEISPFTVKDNDGIKALSELTKDKDRSMLWRIGKALTFPDLWMASLSYILIGIGSCFFYVNVISYLMSVGFDEQIGVQFVSFMALSSLVGKVLLVVIGEYVPFPRIYLEVISNLICIIALISFMFVTSVIPLMCIAIGQSIDQTGSYESALLAFVGVFATSGVLLLLTPLYQRYFAPERFVTFIIHRRKMEARKKRSTSTKGDNKNEQNLEKEKKHSPTL
ncbi:uncharacterized protein LOC121419151 isoform X2 [Lytechinus variegatus]|uniref:uncharacterized protein LOC121419151 isoform X2 n=1 Tax=Lytechinus variegatus TaxID=7654 RepID=UPI001BB1FA2C|nr:uncharacterized protein LOC121419151 isoform X2 [Lytechinus variegatus]